MPSRLNFTIEALCEDALLLRFGEQISAALNAEVHAAAHALRSAQLAGVRDIVPAYASLLLRFDPQPWVDMEPSAALPHTGLMQAVHSVLSNPHPTQSGSRYNEPRACIEIPVSYGGAHGPDLPGLAEQAGLSPAEFVTRHTAPEYCVAMLGFAPGFPYLLGLDRKLEAPRRATPRTRVPAGSVAIGGAQTGIYPRVLPGGWNLIGRTPLLLFDPHRDPPCLLGPGDRVRFHAITAADFAALGGRAA